VAEAFRTHSLQEDAGEEIGRSTDDRLTAVA
jgi:hypothetical protein